MKKVKLVFVMTIAMTLGLVVLTPSMVNSSTQKVKMDGKEEQDIYDFVYAEITTKIRAVKQPKISKELFSRCPSGYYAELAEEYDTKSRSGEGIVYLYHGCEGEPVCKFKVDMDKNVALISPLNEENFVSVDTWLLDDEKAQNVTQTKK